MSSPVASRVDDSGVQYARGAQRGAPRDPVRDARPTRGAPRAAHVSAAVHVVREDEDSEASSVPRTRHGAERGGGDARSTSLSASDRVERRARGHRPAGHAGHAPLYAGVPGRDVERGGCTEITPPSPVPPSIDAFGRYDGNYDSDDSDYTDGAQVHRRYAAATRKLAERMSEVARLSAASILLIVLLILYCAYLSHEVTRLRCFHDTQDHYRPPQKRE